MTKQQVNLISYLIRNGRMKRTIKTNGEKNSMDIREKIIVDLK